MPPIVIPILVFVAVAAYLSLGPPHAVSHPADPAVKV
jgi:hypothetical protein